METFQVIERVYRHCLIDCNVRQLCNPTMFEGILSRWAIFRLVSKQLRDEVLCVIRNGSPTFVVKVKMTTTHLLHDFGVAGTVERWHA